MSFDITTLTIVHTILSLVALALGVPAVARLCGYAVPASLTTLFLLTSVATTATGFVFPFTGPTPAFVTGLVSTLVLIATYAALYFFHLRGVWRRVYAASLVVSFYLLAFVTVAQSFTKVPFLKLLAPTLSEPPFAIAQLCVLVAFVVMGIGVVRQQKTA